MKHSTISKAFAIIDLILSFLYLVGIAVVGGIFIFMGYVLTGGREGIGWEFHVLSAILTIVLCFFAFCAYADWRILKLNVSEKEQDVKSAISACQRWLILSCIVLTVGFVIIIALLYRKMTDTEDLVFENSTLLLVCVFVAQRGLGMMFVNNFKRERQGTFLVITADPIILRAPIIEKQI